jgi:hypothetical protein
MHERLPPPHTSQFPHRAPAPPAPLHPTHIRTHNAIRARRRLLPIAYAFAPDLTIVSAGFDAADGDPLGGCRLSPAAYGHMTALLVPLAPLVLLLEGGYNLAATAASVEACVRVLCGEAPARLAGQAGGGGLSPSAVGLEAIAAATAVQSRFWRCLGSPLPPAPHAAAGPDGQNHRHQHHGGQHQQHQQHQQHSRGHHTNDQQQQQQQQKQQLVVSPLRPNHPTLSSGGHSRDMPQQQQQQQQQAGLARWPQADSVCCAAGVGGVGPLLGESGSGGMDAAAAAVGLSLASAALPLGSGAAATPRAAPHAPSQEMQLESPLMARLGSIPLPGDGGLVGPLLPPHHHAPPPALGTPALLPGAMSQPMDTATDALLLLGALPAASPPQQHHEHHEHHHHPHPHPHHHQQQQLGLLSPFEAQQVVGPPPAWQQQQQQQFSPSYAQVCSPAGASAGAGASRMSTDGLQQGAALSPGGMLVGMVVPPASEPSAAAGHASSAHPLAGGSGGSGSSLGGDGALLVALAAQLAAEGGASGELPPGMLPSGASLTTSL